MSDLNEQGQEIFDQTPVSYPFNFERPLPLHIRIRQQILQAMADVNKNDEVESIEEADDFEMDDDPDMWRSPYEQDFDHVNANLKTLSEVSKEESAEGGSSDGTSQAEASKAEAKTE